MGELNTTVLKGFGLRAGRVKREKAYFICETPDGARMIRQTSERAERIYYQHAIKEHLIQAGFPWVDRYCLTPSGVPYVMQNGNCYVMTVFFEHREADFQSWPDFARVVEAVAHWHACARNLRFPENVSTFTPAPPLTEIYKRQSSELASIRKRVGRQARLSDFDVLFIKNVPYYTNRIMRAAHDLAQTDYALWYARALANHYLCHNALKEESVLFAGYPSPNGSYTGERVYITQYASVCADVQINDLCSLIRRYVQRAGIHAVPLSKILETYDRVESLPYAGVAILRALLQFPSSFMKIVSQYYSKKRTWTPNAIANRMLTAVSEREAYERYIYTNI